MTDINKLKELFLTQEEWKLITLTIKDDLTDVNVSKGLERYANKFKRIMLYKKPECPDGKWICLSSPIYEEFGFDDCVKLYEQSYVVTKDFVTDLSSYTSEFLKTATGFVLKSIIDEKSFNNYKAYINIGVINTFNDLISDVNSYANFYYIKKMYDPWVASLTELDIIKIVRESGKEAKKIIDFIKAGLFEFDVDYFTIAVLDNEIMLNK